MRIVATVMSRQSHTRNNKGKSRDSENNTSCHGVFTDNLFKLSSPESISNEVRIKPAVF